VSDFISSPHFPFKSLIRLLLRHIVVCRLTCTTPCRHIMPVSSGAHIAHGTQQRTQSGGQERWTDPTVETSMRPVAGPLCAPLCACLVGERAWRGVSSRPSRLRVDNPCSAAALRPTGRHGSHWLAALRQSSARRAEAVISSQHGGCHRLAARRQSSARRTEAVMCLRRLILSERKFYRMFVLKTS
jgi:hypothetical protein